LSAKYTSPSEADLEQAAKILFKTEADSASNYV